MPKSDITIDDFIILVRKNLVDTDIAGMCKELGLIPLGKTITKEQKTILQEALFVARKGTCIDESLSLIYYLSKQSRDKINKNTIEALLKKVSEYQDNHFVFHGISQGPYQRKCIKEGKEICELIYKKYGLTYNCNAGTVFDIARKDTEQKLLNYLENHKKQILLLQLIDTDNNGSHIITLYVSNDNVLVCDEGKLFELLIDYAFQALTKLIKEYSEESFCNFTQVKLQDEKDLNITTGDDKVIELEFFENSSNDESDNKIDLSGNSDDSDDGNIEG